MKKQFTEKIISYLQKIKSANKELTKKEHFKDLLHQLYHGEKEIENLPKVWALYKTIEHFISLFFHNISKNIFTALSCP